MSRDPKSEAGDIEQQVVNMAYNFCQREQEGENPVMEDWLKRKPLSEDPNAAREFQLLVSMHRIFVAMESGM